ncbi:MAG: AAA family ATPase, partial [Dehalococcoidia bacterium]
DLRPPPQLESPEQARFRLFDSIASFLKSASQKQPLVLVLDDLHWADQPSLLLLQFVARELGNSRLLLIGTYRDMELSRQHPLAETLGELTRERLFQRVLLRGLSQQDVGRFIEVAAGVDPPSGLVGAVHTQTEGNPLFVTEVVRLLVQEGELTQESGPRDSWTVRIPEGVREVIGRRLNRLSQRCNETLTIASVIGREFELRQLAPLVEDMSEDRLLEVLEEALAARVIEELPQAVGRYQFTHALIQETLSEELTLTRRVRLHARIAETLEELYGVNAEAHAAELAHHFAQAEAVMASNKLVHYSLLAGERALAAYGWEEALSHFERGLMSRGVPLVGPEAAPDQEAAALLFGLGKAQLSTLERYQWPQAVVSLHRSFNYYAEAGDVSAAVAIAEYPTHNWPGEHQGAAEMIAHALALVPADSPEAGRLLSRYGRALGVEEDRYEEAQEAFARALAIAQREGDTALEMGTLANAVTVDNFHFHHQDGLEKGLRAIELASHVDNPLEEMNARFYLTNILFFIGELDRAGQQAMDLLTVAERVRDRSWLAAALYKNVQVSSIRGDWEAAREFSDRDLILAPQHLPGIAARSLLEYEVGEFSQGEHYLELLLEVMSQTRPGPTFGYAYPAMFIPLVGRTSGVVEKFDIAKTAAETVFSGPSVAPFIALYARVGLAWLAVQLGDKEASEEQYTVLEHHKGTFLPVTLRAADRLLGLLAQTMGNLDQAAAHFEDALALCQKAAYRPELAWTCCDYADTLLERSGPGDREKAMSLLDESLAISSELGMRPLMERVLSRREILRA